MNECDDAPDAGRRMILQGAAAGGLAAVAFGAFPWPAYADADAKEWPADAFKQKSEADTLKALYGKSAEPSDKISLDAPEIAENGAVVPIGVSSTLPKVTGIALLVLENPNVLAAAYKIPDGTEASVSNRLKMAKTSKVVAVVESGGKLYSASKEVKVTVGGCGG
ncbi:MAG TPA: thiosulfate oxidation carrier protein SoxY [Pseudolabrys sp.]|jgi:sulfur-oxidizing protein SoxY|nr:thiosulfate oxidation carrier protein SoxY [Pseudolabrys sp.]